MVEPDPAQCLALAERIATLHTQHGQEPAVREALAKALLNATVGEPDATQRRELIVRLADLATNHPDEPLLAQVAAQAREAAKLPSGSWLRRFRIWRFGQ